MTVHNPIPLAKTSTPNEQGRSFFQRRLHFFAKLTFSIFFVLMGLTIVLYALLPETQPKYVRVLHSLGLVGLGWLGVVWWVCRPDRSCSVRMLNFWDGALVVVLGALMGIGCVLAYDREANMWTMFIWTAFMVLGRVLYIPSTGRRTALLSSLALLPIVIAAATVAIVYPSHISVPGSVWIGGAGLYSILTVVIAAVGSRVIYGLRKQIRAARRLGQYTLGRKIGEGGMGVVYEAHHALLRRRTAIKLVQPDKAGPDSISRFEREVQLTAQLTHPNTVAVYDFGRSRDGLFYYAMEYLDGLDLATLVELDGAQKAGRVLRILIQAGGALEEAHGMGLIHRDIKPANILLCERGGIPDVAKVVDFGLVKDLADGTTTTASLAAGTPAYISPEGVMAPHEVGPPSDIYALGAVAYFLLSGRTLFDAKTAMEMCVHHVRTEPIFVGEVSEYPLSDEFAALIMRCLRKDPKERPQSAGQLCRLLTELPEAGAWGESDASKWWRELDKSKLRRGALHIDPAASMEHTATVVNIRRANPDKLNWQDE